MSPKLSDPPPRPDPSTHAPTVMDAFANMVVRMREVIAAHPDWTPEQIRAKVASYPDTVPPPSSVPDDLVERARSAGEASLNRDPDGDVPCCPREAVGSNGWGAPPCDCQRLYQ